METGDTGIPKKEYTAAEKQALVASWKQSGQSMIAFSRTIGVNYHTFINWIKPKKQKKLIKAGSGKLVSGFSEIVLPASESGNLFARIAIGKTQLYLFQPVSADFLLRLLDA